MVDVVCLRPEEDFRAVGVSPPSKKLWIEYRTPSDKDVGTLLQDASALVLPSAGHHLDDHLFKHVPNLKLIQFTGAGWDRISEPILRQIGCFVSNVPGVNAIDVAEYTVIAAGTLLRKIKFADTEILEGRYSQARQALAAENVRGFRGLTVGVVGLGHIGFTVAKLFHTLGAKILYYDPFPRYPSEAAELGFTQLSLEQLFTQVDVVTLHVPLTSATSGLIGAAELRRLKSDAIVIQASRGGVIDEHALFHHLQDGLIAGVALDVYTTEPLPADAALLEEAKLCQDRLLLTPHIAGVTKQAASSLYTAAWTNVERVLLEDTSPLYQVF